ncbi:hypothetical protein SAMN05216188_115164 [Lentzea xinjiangensis]|uniref:HTH araC/xylS-type domain-containing protein n=1 Tax=Lentzea xinjiangensis TaxID=402600 RepID=A0A1H9S275_9PSEU|nr:hypothetical protein [Lentzea xinjiangensis]SER78239.1 hypothetical protein SAMN05216188_115164 [Lentzea xinjiangensis]
MVTFSTSAVAWPLLPDAIFVADGDVLTSAGVTAGMDLALALVERDYGADLARTVARGLVMFMQRPGGQSQFSAPLRVRAPRTPAVREVVGLVSAQPALGHSPRSLAARAGSACGAWPACSPVSWTPRPRGSWTGPAGPRKALLDAGHGVVQAARLAGFGSTETMQRVFVARFGASPNEYRAQFGSTRGCPAGALEAAARGVGVRTSP